MFKIKYLNFTNFFQFLQKFFPVKYQNHLLLTNVNSRALKIKFQNEFYDHKTQEDTTRQVLLGQYNISD